MKHSVIFSLLFSVASFLSSGALAQTSPNRITYQWPDSNYQFDLFTEGAIAGFVAKGPSAEKPSEFTTLKISRSAPYVISAVPAEVHLRDGVKNLGRDMSAPLQLVVCGEDIIFFTKHGLTFVPQMFLNASHPNLRVHFNGNKALVQFRDATNEERHLLFIQNHVVEIPKFLIDADVRKFGVDAEAHLIVNDKTVGKLADFEDVKLKSFHGTASVEASKLQAPLVAEAEVSEEAAKVQLDESLVPPSKTKAAAKDAGADAAKMNEHWQASIEIAHAQGRKHISEVEAESQQDGASVKAFEVVKNFVRDLDVEYKDGEYALDHDEREIEDSIITVMHNAEVANVKYVGPGGSGKSTSLRNIVYRRRDGDQIGQFNKYAFLELNLSAMSSSKYKGSEGAAVNALVALAEAYKKAGYGLVLVVDEAHTMKPGSSSEGSTDMTQTLKPYLANGTIRIVGISTLAEWNQAFIQDVAFNSRFALVEKKEPKGERLVKMLQVWARRNHRPELTKEVAELIVKLSNRFDPVGAQPRRGVRLMDTMYSDLLVKGSEQAPTIDDVVRIAAKFYRVDRAEFDEGERIKRLAELQDTLEKNVVGQSVAKEALLEAEMISVTGSGTEGQMQHRLLLTGPAGSGRSTLVKTLADVTKKKLTEIDLTQYREANGVSAVQQVIAKAAGESSIGILSFKHLESASLPVQFLLADILKTGRLEVMMDRNIQEFNLRNMTFIASAAFNPEKAPGELADSQALRKAVGERVYAGLLGELDVVPVVTPRQDAVKAVVKKILDDAIEAQASQAGRKIALEHEDALVEHLLNKYAEDVNGSDIRREIQTSLSKAIAQAKVAGGTADLELTFKDGKLASKHFRFDALRCARAAGAQ